MFRKMRRMNQALTKEESIEILKKGTSGVLALSGDNDYPYAVPLNYVYHDSKIYFHCAREGHKLDAISQNNKVSFCVIGQDKIIPDKYTSYYRSVIVFGRARLLENEQEKRFALEMLAARFTPDDEQGRLKEIDKLYERVVMIELSVEHMTGKEAIELKRV